MSDLIDRDDTLKIIADTISMYGTGTKVESEILSIVSKIPCEEPYKNMILQAGKEGREVEFRIGGRLFAIREKAQ